MSKSSQVNEECLLANREILGTYRIKGEEVTTEEMKKKNRERERRKVAENEHPKFGKERSGAGGGRVMQIDPEIRGGEQMRGEIKERKSRLHRRVDEMAGLQRSSRFKSGPSFHRDRLLREGLGETVSERW